MVGKAGPGWADPLQGSLGHLTSLGNWSLFLGLYPASQELWAPSMHGLLASHLQITLALGLGHWRCCTTKSLPPIMEPE